MSSSDACRDTNVVALSVQAVPGAPCPVIESSPRSGRVGHGAVLFVASFGAFLAFLDSTVVNVAFPSIGSSFPHTSLGGLSWVLNAYNIVFAAFLVAAGRFADLLGRRRTFRMGTALFTGASVLCAASTSVPELVTMRAVQAIGAALLVPASLALVVDAFPPSRRAHAIGLWGAAGAAAAGLGPPIGGGLVDVAGWRLAFLINLPLGVVSWYAGRRLLVESRAPGKRSMPDLRGAAALAGALALLTLGIIEGGSWGWASIGVIGVFAGSIACAVGFVASSRVHPSPMLDRELLRIRSFTVANSLTVVAGAGFYAYLLTHILWLHEVWGYSVLKAGLALAPAAVVAAVVASVVGKIADDHGARVVVVPGALLWSLAYVWYVTRVGTTPDFLGEWLPGQILSGIGVGCTLPIVTSASLTEIPGGRFATASAVISSTRQLGGVLGISLLVVIIGTPHPLGLPTALRHGWLFSAICFGLVSVGALALPTVLAANEVAEIKPEPVALAAAAVPRARAAASDRRIAASETASPQTLLELLKSVPVLAGLDDESLTALAHGAKTVAVPAGEWLFQQGDRADAGYVVRSGVLEVHKDGEPVASVARGEVLGELALLTGEPRAAGVQARRDSELLRVTKRRFDEIIGTDASALRALASGLARQVQIAAPVTRSVARARTLAVVALDGLVPTGMLIELLERSLAGSLRTCRMTSADPGQLEAAERDNDLVILPADGRADDPWRSAAIRQADRLLLLAASGSEPTDLPPGSLPEVGRGQQVDLLLLGPTPPRELLGRWHDAVAPRTCRWAELSVASLSEAADRYAARLAGRSVGLVLSGGGARALAHLGVVDELHAAGIRIDRVAGTSMGSYIAALVASGRDPEQVESQVYAEFVRRSPVGDWGLPRTSLMRGKRGRAMVDRSFGPMIIEELPLEYYAAATDLHRRELVIHRRGLIQDVVGSSMCIPGVLPPVVMGDRVLVDGGVLDNLPVTPMAESDDGPIIAVNVVDGESRAVVDGAPRVPGLQETMMRAMTMVSGETAARSRDKIDLLITPQHHGVGLLEFHQIDAMRSAGREAARAALASADGVTFLARL